MILMDPGNLTNPLLSSDNSQIFGANIHTLFKTKLVIVKVTKFLPASKFCAFIALIH